MPRPRKLAPQRKALAPSATIEAAIHTVRGDRVILDADLAKIYGVETRTLNQAVNRNRDKFPSDFLLQLTSPEVLAVNRSQIVIGSSQRHRDPNSRPFAFTEHGAIMALLDPPPSPPEQPKREIGFHAGLKESGER